MDSAISVGIVGYGLIGRTHARALGGVADAALVAVVSRGGRDRANADVVADDVRWYPTLADVAVDDLPAVIAICTPPGLHGSQARAALERGAHVLVEKPPAGTVGELESLIRLAAERHKVLAVVSQHRMEPQIRHVAAVAGRGLLGVPLLAEVRLHWHRPQRYYDDAPWRATDRHGGSLANQGWHAVDLLTWFMGPADTVTAQTATLAHTIGVEDVTVAGVRFRSGAMGSIVTTTAAVPAEPAEIGLYFERGSVQIRDTRIVEWNAPDDVPPPPTARHASSGADDPAAIGALGHRDQWEDLIRAVRDGSTPAVPASESAHTLALIEAIYRSADDGVAVTVAGENS